MINIFSDDNNFAFDAQMEIATSKRFFKLPINSFGKFEVALLKINDELILCEGATVSSLDNNINIYVDGRILSVVKEQQKDLKKLIKQTKKYFKFYDSKFQLGLSPSELENLFESKKALVKFKLMKHHGISIVGERVKND